MDDSVNNLVMAALPGVEEMAVEKVCDKLTSLGVLTTSDIEFVESKDIEEVLPPIQSRKLIQYFQEIIQTKNNSLLVEEGTQPLLNPQPTTPSYILIDNSSQSTEYRARIIAVAPCDWAESIYEFMRCQNSKQRLSECVKHIDHSKERLQNSTPEILGAFLLLLAYFEEDERFFLQIFKDLPNIDDVENQCPVLTPSLGVFVSLQK